MVLGQRLDSTFAIFKTPEPRKHHTNKIDNFFGVLFYALRYSTSLSKILVQYRRRGGSLIRENRKASGSDFLLLSFLSQGQRELFDIQHSSNGARRIHKTIPELQNRNLGIVGLIRVLYNPHHPISSSVPALARQKAIGVLASVYLCLSCGRLLIQLPASKQPSGNAYKSERLTGRLGDMFGHQAAVKKTKKKQEYVQRILDNNRPLIETPNKGPDVNTVPAFARVFPVPHNATAPYLAPSFCRKPWGGPQAPIEPCAPFLFQGSHSRLQADRQSADLQLGRPCPGIFWTNHIQGGLLGGVFALSLSA